MTRPGLDASVTVSGEPDEALAKLGNLVDRGFQFVHPTGPDGAVEAVIGVRMHEDVIDVVHLRGSDDVTAARMSADEADILTPDAVLWQSSGDAAAVLDEVLALPDRDAEVADQAHGVWVPGRPGESKWVTHQGR